MKLPGLLPWWLCPLAVVALAGLNVYQRANLNAERLEWATERLEWATERLESAKKSLKAIDVAQAQTIHMQEVKDAALKAAQDRANTNGLAAAGARTQLDGLRYELAISRAALPTLSHQACLARADTLTELFDQCAGMVEERSRKADGHANDALTSDQAWPTPK